MRKVVLLGLLSMLLVSCSIHMGTDRDYYGRYYPKPKLQLIVVDYDDFHNEVYFEAFVREQLPAHPKYACLQVFWAFGDGRDINLGPDCNRFGEPHDGVGRVYHYKYSHKYRYPGKYRARLILYDRRGKAVLKSNKVTVRVY